MAKRRWKECEKEYLREREKYKDEGKSEVKEMRKKRKG